MQKLASDRDIEHMTRGVEVQVTIVVRDFHLVLAQDDAGHRYALTRRTRGVDLASLKEGQRLTCRVTLRLHRVLEASPVPF